MENNDYFVLQYRFIDCPEFALPPERVYLDKKELLAKSEKVKLAFRAHGWEGDGDLSVIWLPPFLDEATDDTFGSFVWHVKQQNDGLSFLGFETPICSARLLEQNSPPKYNFAPPLVPITITQPSEEYLLDRLKEKSDSLIEMRKLFSEHTMSQTLEDALLGYIQNGIFADFVDFMDDCYLHILIYVLDGSNEDKLLLRLNNVKLNLKPLSKSTASSGGYWLTIKNLIQNIWDNFKFLPFTTKFNEITLCIDLPQNNNTTDLVNEIRKHVEIRNCIQHHQWQLKRAAVRSLGLNRICVIDKDEKKVEIYPNQKIQLSINELEQFIEILRQFSATYGEHIKQRMVSRHYMSENNESEEP